MADNSLFNVDLDSLKAKWAQSRAKFSDEKIDEKERRLLEELDVDSAAPNPNDSIDLIVFDDYNYKSAPSVASSPSAALENDDDTATSDLTTTATDRWKLYDSAMDDPDTFSDTTGVTGFTMVSGAGGVTVQPTAATPTGPSAPPRPNPPRPPVVFPKYSYPPIYPPYPSYQHQYLQYPRQYQQYKKQLPPVPKPIVPQMSGVRPASPMSSFTQQQYQESYSQQAQRILKHQAEVQSAVEYTSHQWSSRLEQAEAENKLLREYLRKLSEHVQALEKRAPAQVIAVPPSASEALRDRTNTPLKVSIQDVDNFFDTGEHESLDQVVMYYSPQTTQSSYTISYIIYGYGSSEQGTIRIKTISYILHALDDCKYSRTLFMPEFKRKIMSNKNEVMYLTDQEIDAFKLIRHLPNRTNPELRQYELTEMFFGEERREYDENRELVDGICGLRYIRTVDKKLEILQRCILSNATRDALLAVLISCEETLEFDVFFREILLKAGKPVLDSYISYLEQMERYDYLLKLFRKMNLKGREFQLMLRMASKERDSVRRFEMSERCLQFARYFSAYDPYLAGHVPFLDQYLRLFSREMRVEEYDQHALKSKTASVLFSRWPRRHVVGVPSYSLLQYVIFYHSKDEERSVSNPYAIAKMFSVSERRFFYTALKCRHLQRDWYAIQSIVPTSVATSTLYSLFGSSGNGHYNTANQYLRLRKDCPLSIEEILDIVCTDDVTPAMLQEHLFSLWHPENPESKYNAAMKGKKRLWLAGLDAAFALKEKERVENLRSMAYEALGAEGSREIRARCDALLNDTKIKWKDQYGKRSSSILGAFFKK